ncbi:hypothetical protein J3R82DRAFT_6441 [Butyriboletus roseoflavus]|nr:hypothetical protein J3R82DRAFT_6441 [Butyriboletus roseoflavus]
MAIFNTVQNFATLKLTRRLYIGVAPTSSKPLLPAPSTRHNAPTVTGLQARTFAAWTLTAAVVRGYAAYNIHSKVVYDMALFTYLIAFGHFTSELFIFRTAKFNVPVLSPMIVSS